MMTYKDWAPTIHDTRGLSLADKQDWLVLDIPHNRDSDALERSNARVAQAWLSDVDPDGNDHEVHRFGHWACGWFEIILVRPESNAAACACDIEHRIERYPVLNEDDYCQLTSDEESAA